MHIGLTGLQNLSGLMYGFSLQPRRFPMRFFNTAGPVRSADHYCLPPLERLDLDDVMVLIDQQKYFILHAPRQTGKTTCLLSLMDKLNREGKYRCLYFNVEIAQTARENVQKGM